MKLQRTEPEEHMEHDPHGLFSSTTAVHALTRCHDAHPFIASVALARGEVYRRITHREALDDGHALKADPVAFDKAIAELPARLIANISNGEGDYNRLYLCDDGTSIVNFLHSEDAVHYCGAHLIGDVLCDRWRAAVRGFQQKVRERRARETNLCVLARGMDGYGLSRCGVERSPFIGANYDTRVIEAIQAASRELVAKEPSGRLLLLEGPPGTGKTRAVRSMIAGLSNRARVVIVPPHLISGLAGPDLIGTLLGCTMPTVLVIEDADYALLDREHRSDADKQGATGALSAMLNLTDGILGAQIDLRVIVTTNARIDQLDAAVLRPGRLLDRIAFGALDAEQARAAALHELRGEIKRGKVDPAILRAQIVAPMTLAEVYALANAARKASAAANDAQPATEAA